MRSGRVIRMVLEKLGGSSRDLGEIMKEIVRGVVMCLFRMWNVIVVVFVVCYEF